LIRGRGKNATKILRGFTGNFITSMGGYSGLEDLQIDGQTAIYGAGKGVIFTGTTPNAHMSNVEIKNFVEACLDFGADAGAEFRAINCDLYTTGTVGTVGAVTISGIDTAATSRHFTNCESNGCTLFDFGGCNDLYVTGGYTNGLIFSSNSTKVFLNNMRIGAGAGSVTISGTEHQLVNSVFASAIILDATTVSCHVDCGVSANNITDNGTTNSINMHGLVAYTPSWTSSGTAPTLGNGTILGYYTRRGQIIEGTIDLTIGSTTTTGTGTWYFSLPRADYSTPKQVVGIGFTNGAAANYDYVFSVFVDPGNTRVALYYARDAGVANINVLTGTTVSWASGATIRMNFRYFTS